MTCCVRSAIRAEASVGSDSASSCPLVCKDCVPPRTAAMACKAARGTEFCDLFEKVVVGVEEKAQAGCEGIDVEPCCDCCVDIRDCVRQSECHFLNRSRSG